MKRHSVERFQERVRRAIVRRYGSLYRLGKEDSAVVRKPTISAWIRKKRPRVPCSDALLDFARETDTSLNWLLLARGPEQLSVQPDVESLVRVYLLRAVEHYEQHEQKARRELIKELAAKAQAGQVPLSPRMPPAKRSARG